ncbi:MAG TPA: hypothetical protein VFQ35_17405 [Polyangiaceae bacterium]|nr:hypothetical protein [Polyangiaceae bacterium]
MKLASSFAYWSFLALVGACSAQSAGPERSSPNNNGSGSSSNSGYGGSIGIIDVPVAGANTVGQPPMKKCDVCEDFPATPVFVNDAPMNAPSLFGEPSNVSQSGGPCISEPQDGTLFPYNWLRPRIRWSGTSDVYEVRIKTARQKNDFVAYTTKTEFYIPRDVWSGDKDGKSQGLAKNNFEEDITVTVRGVNKSGGTPVGSSVKFRTAAAEAAGTMVYWANVKAQTGDTVTEGDAAGWLMGFSVGDEDVVEALRVKDIKTQTRGYSANPKAVTCIGCHTSTPDGEAVTFTSFFPWGGAIAGVTKTNRGQLPTGVTPSGLAGLQQQWLGAWTYTPAEWRDGYKIAVTSFGPSMLGWPGGDLNKTNADNLLWVNIATPEPATAPTQDWELVQKWTPEAQGKALGILPRNGDKRAALMPDFSNQPGNTTIAYTSSSTSQDGRIALINDTDIYTVPFNRGAGGNATPLPGASAKGVAEYYPNYSGDDAFVAFNRIDNVMSLVKSNPVGFQNHLYYRPESEIWITPVSGNNVSAANGETSAGSAVRLKANDPDTCGGKKSPGVLNSWAKFSPTVTTVNGKTYYFLIFSSTRNTPDNQRAPSTNDMYKPVENLFSRLFMAAFTVEGGKVTTYPAVYLWNQEENSNNLTPAWDNFKIPEVPPPVVPR